MLFEINQMSKEEDGSIHCFGFSERWCNIRVGISVETGEIKGLCEIGKLSLRVERKGRSIGVLVGIKKDVGAVIFVIADTNPCQLLYDSGAWRGTSYSLAQR